MLKKILTLLVFTFFTSSILSANVLTSDDLLKEASKQIKSLNTNEVLAKLKENPNIHLIDVRPKEEDI